MAEPRLIKPVSFKNFVAEIETLQGRAEKSLWFRGCCSSQDKLAPGAYREIGRSANKYDPAIEKRLITRFRQRSIPFLDHPLSDNDWDTLFLMQHYGIPTRLLDWTENPFIALYFAAMGESDAASVPYRRFRKNACVWALDPIKWNRQSLAKQSYEGDILAPGDEETKAYRPASDFSGAHPLCIYGSHNSRRIVAQRGVFTVFGQGNRPMESLHLKPLFSDSCLVKIELNKRFLPTIRESLLSYGITESTIFPDLAGLAQELKREFGY